MEIMIIVACSIVSSSFYVSSLPWNDTFKEIFIWTWVLACISWWVALIIYSIRENVIACSAIWLMTWALWPEFAKKYANRILDKATKLWQKK